MGGSSSNGGVHILDILKDRGFFFQCTDEAALRKVLDLSVPGCKPVTLYVGFDATAESLHVGNLTALMAMRHFQATGHRVVALAGGATTLIGDPTDRTDLRKMLTRGQIAANVECIKSNFRQFLQFDGSDGPRVALKASAPVHSSLLVNNLDWLGELNYLEFLRDYGVHFSVNRMVAQDSVKLRMEKGLTFLEFNYSLLQAFDFMHLNKVMGCSLQCGGADQWGNIVAGVDLTRRMNQKEVFGLTFPLLTTADGKKMGKTASGAVWLSADLLKPYDYYQYWVNVDDAMVETLLKRFTEVPLDQIAELCREGGAALRKAKETLAFEATRLCHGDVEALKAREGAKAAFGGGGDVSQMPTHEMSETEVGLIRLADLFVRAGLCSSKGQFRSELGKGVRINDEVIADIGRVVQRSDLGQDRSCLLRLGKKAMRIVVK
ncbi:MAG: tyrosine--tRNA ligase [Planctomycetota bacterium]